VDKPWLIVSVGMIVPITLLRAIRFYQVAPPGSLPGIAEALRLTLVASAANVFMPAKSGDLIKSYFVTKSRGASAGVSVAMVVYERLCDLFGLITWCALGWLVARPVVAGVPSALWPLLGIFGALCGVLISSATVARVGAALSSRVLAGRSSTPAGTGGRLARPSAPARGAPGRRDSALAAVVARSRNPDLDVHRRALRAGPVHRDRQPLRGGADARPASVHLCRPWRARRWRWSCS